MEKTIGYLSKQLPVNYLSLAESYFLFYFIFSSSPMVFNIPGSLLL